MRQSFRLYTLSFQKAFTFLEVALATLALMIGAVAVARIFQAPLETIPQLDAEYRQRVVVDQMLQNQAERLKDGNTFNSGLDNSFMTPALGPYRDTFWVYTRADSDARKSGSYDAYIQDITLIAGNPGGSAGYYGAGAGGGGCPLLAPLDVAPPGTNPFTSGWPVYGLNFTPRDLNTTPVATAPVPNPVSNAHSTVIQAPRDLFGFDDRLHFSEPPAGGSIYTGHAACADEFKFSMEFMWANNGVPASLNGAQARLYFRNKLDGLGKLTNDSYRGTVRVNSVGIVDADGIQHYNATLGLVDVLAPAVPLASVALPANAIREHAWYKLEVHVTKLASDQNKIDLTLFEEGGTVGAPNPITAGVPGDFSVNVGSLSFTDAATVRTNVTQYSGVGASAFSLSTASLGNTSEGLTLGGVPLSRFSQNPAFRLPAAIFGFSDVATDYPVSDMAPFMIAHNTPSIDPSPGGRTDLPMAYVGQPYNPFVLTATSGHSTPYAWSISAGALPPDFEPFIYDDPAGSGAQNKYMIRLKPAFSTVPASSVGTFDFTMKVTSGHNKTEDYRLEVTDFYLLPSGKTPPEEYDLPPATAGDFWPPYVIEAEGGVLNYTWKFKTGGVWMTPASPPYDLTNEDPNCAGLVGEVFNAGGENKMRIRLNTADNKVPTTSLGDCRFELQAQDNNLVKTDNQADRYHIRVDQISVSSPPPLTYFYIAADAAVPANTFKQPFLAAYTGNNYPVTWSLLNGDADPPGGTKTVPGWLGIQKIGDPATSLDAELYNSGVIGANCDGNGCPWEYYFRVKVQDNNGRKSEVHYHIILSKVAINDNPLPDGMTGQNYPLNPIPAFTASGGTPPYNWSIVSEDAPWVMAIDPATGQLSASGPASCTGPCPTTYNLRVRVVDNSGIPAERTFQFKIVDIAIVAPPVNTVYYIAAQTAVPANTWLSTPPAFQLNYTGSDFPITWSLNGFVPPWLSVRNLGDPATSLLGELYNSGIIGANCDGNGCPFTYTFQVRATDAMGKYHELAYKIILSDIAIDPKVMPNGQNGLNYPLAPIQFTSTGGTAPYTWTLLSENAPWAMTLTDNGDGTANLDSAGPATCSLGCPQTYFLTLEIRDTNGATARRTFNFTIVNNVFDGAVFFDNAFLNLITMAGGGGGPAFGYGGTYITGPTGRLTINRLTSITNKPGF